MFRRTVPDVTIPDPGDLLFPGIPVEAIRAYSVGRLPDFVAENLRMEPREEKPDDGMRVRVAQVKIDGVWVNL